MNIDIDDPLREQIEHAIRIIPDFPVAGMRFRDITPILEEIPRCTPPSSIDSCNYDSTPPDCVVCIESFGCVFGAPLAYRLAVRLVLARRQSKLPRETIRQE